MYKYKYVYETVGDERPTVIDEINDLTYEKTKNKRKKKLKLCLLFWPSLSMSNTG